MKSVRLTFINKQLDVWFFDMVNGQHLTTKPTAEFELTTKIKFKHKSSKS